MSEVIEVQPVKRGPGRPRKIHETITAELKTVAATPEPEPEATTPEPPEIADDELEGYDLGDISAREGWSKRSGKPFARRSDYKPSMHYLPDLLPPGTLVFRHDPTKQFNRAWLEEDGSRYSRQTALFMKQKGYRVAMAEDFIICPELRDVIKADADDRLAFTDTNGKSAAVIMVRDLAAYSKDREVLLENSRSIQLSYEEKTAKMAEDLRRAGMAVQSFSKVEDE